MSLDQNLNKILIVDFGSQFTQLIARRVRELGIFSEIVSHKKINLKQIDYSHFKSVEVFADGNHHHPVILPHDCADGSTICT